MRRGDLCKSIYAFPLGSYEPSAGRSHTSSEFGVFGAMKIIPGEFYIILGPEDPINFPNYYIIADRHGSQGVTKSSNLEIIRTEDQQIYTIEH